MKRTQVEEQHVKYNKIKTPFEECEEKLQAAIRHEKECIAELQDLVQEQQPSPSFPRSPFNSAARSNKKTNCSGESERNLFNEEFLNNNSPLQQSGSRRERSENDPL